MRMLYLRYSKRRTQDVLYMWQKQVKHETEKQKEPFPEKKKEKKNTAVKTKVGEALYALFESVLCAFLPFFLSIFFHITVYRRKNNHCRVAKKGKIETLPSPICAPQQINKQNRKKEAWEVSISFWARLMLSISGAAVAGMARCTVWLTQLVRVGCLEVGLERNNVN